MKTFVTTMPVPFVTHARVRAASITFEEKSPARSRRFHYASIYFVVVACLMLVGVFVSLKLGHSGRAVFHAVCCLLFIAIAILSKMSTRPHRVLRYLKDRQQWVSCQRDGWIRRFQCVSCDGRSLVVHVSPVRVADADSDGVRTWSGFALFVEVDTQVQALACLPRIEDVADYYKHVASVLPKPVVREESVEVVAPLHLRLRSGG